MESLQPYKVILSSIYYFILINIMILFFKTILKGKPRQSAQMIPIKDEDFAAAEKAIMFVFKINKPEGRKWEQGEILVRISKNPIGEGSTHSIFRGHVISSSKDAQGILVLFFFILHFFFFSFYPPVNQLQVNLC